MLGGATFLYFCCDVSITYGFFFNYVGMFSNHNTKLFHCFVPKLRVFVIAAFTADAAVVSHICFKALLGNCWSHFLLLVKRLLLKVQEFY